MCLISRFTITDGYTKFKMYSGGYVYDLFVYWRFISVFRSWILVKTHWIFPVLMGHKSNEFVKHVYSLRTIQLRIIYCLILYFAYWFLCHFLKTFSPLSTFSHSPRGLLYELNEMWQYEFSLKKFAFCFAMQSADMPNTHKSRGSLNVEGDYQTINSFIVYS